MHHKGRRNIPRRRGDDLVTLPDEIITEILLRLPVQCLLRFKCVCTGWLSLISDPLFAKSRLKRGIPTMKILAGPPFKSLDCQLLDLDGGRSEDAVMYLGMQAMMPMIRPFYSLECLLLYLDERDSEDAVTYLGMPAMMPKMQPRIWGSCDGLVAFTNDRCVILWNPATRMFRKLPSLRTAINRHFILYGLGYDSASDDYKVIVSFVPAPPNFQPMHIDSMELTMKVISLKTNAWRERSHRLSFIMHWRYEEGVFAGDAVHWIGVREHRISATDGECIPFVVSMKMTDESIVEVVQLPSLDWPITWNEEALRLVNFQSWLALYVASFRKFEVWIMNEYGVASSWTKLFAIDLWVPGTVMDSLDILGITRRGTVIIRLNEAWVLLFQLQRLKKRVIRTGNPGSSYPYTAVAYTESLVSPPGFRHIGEL